MSATLPASSPRRAVAYALSAALLLPMVDGLVKLLVQSYPVVVVAWARFAIMTVILGVVMYVRLGSGAFRPQAFGVQFVRASSAVLATGLFYAGLQRLPLGESTAIMCLAPALAAAIAHLWLGERARPLQWSGILISLAGALMVARPGSELFTPLIILPLVASLAFATFILASRLAGSRDDPRTTTFWTSLGGFLLFSLALPFSWEHTTVTPDWALFVCVGALGALGQLATALAYRHGQTAVVAPIGYTSLIVAAMLGVVFFQHIMTVLAGLGMVMIGIGGILVIRGPLMSTNTDTRPRSRAV
ncbi:MAG: DMT family transporter [Burkholderiaceae bacterium]